jgi:AmiR/NasT family two-component response regulator
MSADEGKTMIRVLLAEDDDNARGTMVALLEALGYMVVAEVANGEAAVAAAVQYTPDAVLLDLHMPGATDGRDAAHDIAEQLPGVAVVLFTGDMTLSLSPEDAMRTHAVALLAKPVQPSTLDSTLRLAVVRARELLEAKQEAQHAKEQLEARKLIERAKGILMRRTGTSEAEAYRIMQRTSQDKSVPMVSVAKAVISSEPGQKV